MRYFLFSLFSLLSFSVFAAPPVTVTPIVKEVTVYRSGARIAATGKVKVPAGRSEVIFENLSASFNGNSLQVQTPNGVRLFSAAFQVKTPAPVAENPRIQVLRDSLVLLNDSLYALRSETQVYAQERNLVEKNITQTGMLIPGVNGVKMAVEELRQLANFYRQRLIDLNRQTLRVAVLERKMNEAIRVTNERLVKLYPNTTNSSGQIVLKIESPTAQTIDITCTFLSGGAYWVPLYDLRANSLDQPLQLTYKANVYNQTGFDWKNVKLSLSSALPLSNNDRPVLNPVFIDFRPANVYYERKPSADMARSQNYKLEAQNMAMAPATQEVVDDVFKSGGEPAPEYIEDDPSDLAELFEIAELQDIPSGVEENTIVVKEEEVPASYMYHAVPKAEPSVFLLAKITDYGKYSLLAGNANIFFKQTFIGQTYINPNVASDTLLLSLGRDEQVTIKRVQPKELTGKKKVLNSSVKETFSYEITVKNNKNVPIIIEILDQIPVSKQETIEVELTEKDGADYNSSFGKLLWNLELKAGQKKTVKFEYTVKYPKGQKVLLTQ